MDVDGWLVGRGIVACIAWEIQLYSNATLLFCFPVWSVLLTKYHQSLGPEEQQLPFHLNLNFSWSFMGGGVCVSLTEMLHTFSRTVLNGPVSLGICVCVCSCLIEIN